MKKINILLFCLLGLLFAATSCDGSHDDNPVYQSPTNFVLNTPPYSTALYDLVNTKSIALTCSQPDYGYAAPTTYSVQISLNNKWTAAEGFDEKKQTLDTSYPLCDMAVDAKEFDVNICQQLGVASAAEMPTAPIPVYVRLKAQIAGIDTSAIYSNVIKLDKVLPYYALPDMTLPTTMYMIGNFCGWKWADAASMVAINGNPDRFWTIRYVKAGEGFKFNANNAWDGSEFGYNADKVKITHSTACSGVSADKDGNFTVGKSGWYIFAVKSTIAGRGYTYELDVFEPNIYVYGAANGGTWANSDAWKFTVVDDPDAAWPFVSPTVLKTDGTDSSCLRLCIHPTEWDGSIDWWKTEFIFFDGNITYRAAGGDQAHVGNIAGKVYLNFVTGKAKVE